MAWSEKDPGKPARFSFNDAFSPRDSFGSRCPSLISPALTSVAYVIIVGGSDCVMRPIDGSRAPSTSTRLNVSN